MKFALGVACWGATLLLLLAESLTGQPAKEKLEEHLEIVDFRNTPLHDVTRLLSMQTGRHIVASENAAKVKVNVFMKNVPLATVLEVIAQGNNLVIDNAGARLEVIMISAREERKPDGGGPAKGPDVVTRTVSMPRLRGLVLTAAGEPAAYLDVDGRTYFVRVGHIVTHAGSGPITFEVKRKEQVSEMTASGQKANEKNTTETTYTPGTTGVSFKVVRITEDDVDVELLPHRQLIRVR